MDSETGTVDANGVLWKSSRVGSFIEGIPGCENMWDSLKNASDEFAERECVGSRPVVKREMVDGFEKLVLGPYEWITYSQYRKDVEAIAAGLSALPTGLAKGAPIIIYADTQVAWMQFAYAAWRQGLVVGTIYSTLGEEGASYGINLAKCQLVVADGKLLKILAKIAPQCPSIKEVVVISTEGADKEVAALKGANINVTSMAELIKKGTAAPVEPRPSASSDTAVLMYTSGTTGNPKGVLISHSSISAAVQATKTGVMREFNKPGLTCIAYLPLAHIMELVIEVMMTNAGVRLGFGSPGTILATSPKMLQIKPPQEGDALALKPNIFVAAPAVLDKIYTAVKGKIAAAPKPLQRLFACALASGSTHFDNGGVGANSCLAVLFKPVQKLLGGRVQVIVTGSAPLGIETQKFVQTVFACPVRQGYGLTETCAATCLGAMSDNTVQQCGPPQESACIKLRDWEEGNYLNKDKDDPAIGMRRGEILIGGPGVAIGYLVDEKNPDPEVVAKNENDFVTIDGIRYFCTGDIGQFNERGSIQIIDRKKDLVKLQHGEYVALSKVENAIKASKYVALPMVYGRSTMTYVIVLVCPVEPALKSLASSLGESGTIEELCQNAKVIAAVLADLKAVCKAAKLNKFETPEKLVLCSELWTPDNDMLTAVQKLKRKPIADKHAADIDAVYV